MALILDLISARCSKPTSTWSGPAPSRRTRPLFMSMRSARSWVFNMYGHQHSSDYQYELRELRGRRLCRGWRFLASKPTLRGSRGWQVPVIPAPRPAIFKTIFAQAGKGLAVNLPASFPEVTGVGGTQFNEGSGTYWAAKNGTDSSSVLSYIPETSWNETGDGSPLGASGGGTSIYFGKPLWQTGAGVPNDNARDVPDSAVGIGSP